MSTLKPNNVFDFIALCSFFAIISGSIATKAYANESPKDLGTLCQKALQGLPTTTAFDVKKICANAQQLVGCQSEKGEEIFHFDRLSKAKDARRVLVLALVHGDEPESAVVATLWAERLLRIDPRSSWRIIPIVNPDGFRLATRLNSRAVDLNRNFPTNDWLALAREHWEKDAKADPRRYPGEAPGSESETKCVLRHIEEYAPNLVVAIHTPYGVLDFDGPKDLKFPQSFLPWISLGHLPGSLGRYMWHDRQVPVLTIELKGRDSLQSLEALDQLQDASGSLAVQIKPQPASKD